MSISDEELRLAIAIIKIAVFPVVGFIAGFFVTWFLQSRKSRDELLRALAPDRASAFQALWQRIALPDEIRLMKENEIVPDEFLKRSNEDLLSWYNEHANALFLSWTSTKKLFEVFDILRSKKPLKGTVDKVLSSLRTAMKRDCGIYSAWNAWRQLPTPRPQPWPANRALQGTRDEAARP